MKANKKGNSIILIIVLILISVLSFLSLISLKMGLLGVFIRKLFFSLLGFGGYLVPPFIIYISIALYKNKEDSSKNILYLIILFLSFLIVMDIYNNGNAISISEKFNENLELSREGLGSGLVGALLGYCFLKLFGSVGTYIVLSIIIIVATFHFTNIDIKNLYETTKSNITNYIEGIRRKNHTKASKLIEKVRSKFKDEGDLLNEFENTIITDFDLENETSSEGESLLEDIEIQDYIDIEETSSKESVETSSDITNRNVKNTDYIFPSVDLLNRSDINKNSDKKESLEKAKQIEKTMNNFNIDARVTKINRGPTITCYELEPAAGVKVSKILSLADDLALALATSDIRIEAPIPGKAAIGIEVPNSIKDNVLIREILESTKFTSDSNDIPLVLGKDINGEPIISSIDKMPHLLIAGATGSGKSVCINTVITSILYKANPDDVKFLLIDPKVVELSIYNDIPHLLLPVVTSPKDARFALKWAVDEMERRYKLFADNNIRDIKSYNNIEGQDKLSKIIIIVDELSDLMMVSAQEIEDYICRLAQMARAAGIYLIIATQRPSVDVITGTIKANIPSRISFAVSSQIDSRTILDMGGAEKLLGRGDMLFYPSSYSKPKRIQAAFITDEEVFRVVEFIKDKNESDYDEEVIENIKENADMNDNIPKDELLEEALRLVVSQGEASVSMIQRRLRIGYNRAANIIDYMCDNNYISKQDGNKPRKVLITEDDIENII